MKYFKRANVYKNSTGTNYFNPKTMEAHSYGWWCYFRVIDGCNVFNSYSYSSTTSNHQNECKYLLRELGIEIDYFIESPRGLHSLDSALSYAQAKQKKLQAEIDKPRSRARKNEERREQKAAWRAQELLIKNLMKREASTKGGA